MNGVNASPIGNRSEWRKRQSRMLCLIRLAIVLLCVPIFVIGLLLLILPTVKISKIEVSGNTVTKTEDIIESAGIKVGDELYALSPSKIADNIQTKYPSLGVSVRRGVGKISIRVTERGSAYIAYAGHWFLLDDNLTVVTMSDNESDFSAYPRLILPSVTELAIGKKVTFADEGIDRTYVTDLINLLKDEGLLSHTTYIDADEKFHISYVLEGQIRVILGSLSDISLKLEMTEEILNARFENSSPYVIVDVSDLEKTTFRSMQTSDNLLTY